MPRKLTILFSGMVAADPYQGGATWAILQYLIGLQELGHDVYFVEPVRRKNLRPAEIDFSNTENAQYFQQITAEFALAERAALLLEGTKTTVGLGYDQLCSIAQRADLLINVSGMLQDPRLIAGIPVRAYLDLDPVFIQLWAAEYGIDMRFAAHNRFVTIGQSLGDPECPIPTCGIDWIKTLQPVVLGRWPVADEIEHVAFTTVGNWRAYGSAEYEGVFYGQKAHSIRELLHLPRLSSEAIALALTIYPGDEKDVAALNANGWSLLDPRRVARTPADYERFVRGSKAELGLAKSGYVKSRCGWFSDRSVCYLASGRPVVAQETGFSRHLPVGDGLLAFSTAEEASAAITEVIANYDRHRVAARCIAEEVFDSRKVLSQLLEAVL